MQTSTLTIGKLARAAGVGIETVRYYQQRELLTVPPPTGAYRYYPETSIARIRFIKRAQQLGFTLEEIAELLTLQDGSDRAQIRELANAKITDIEKKLQDLQRMHDVLQGLIEVCEHTDKSHPCPIIEALENPA